MLCRVILGVCVFLVSLPLHAGADDTPCGNSGYKAGDLVHKYGPPGDALYNSLHVTKIYVAPRVKMTWYQRSSKPNARGEREMMGPVGDQA